MKYDENYGRKVNYQKCSKGCPKQYYMNENAKKKAN